MYTWQNIINSANGFNNMLMQNMQSTGAKESIIKGAYVSTVNEVAKLQSSTLEPAICADLTNNKIYVKTFNQDKTFKIMEYLPNEKFVFDPRSTEEKLNETIKILINKVEKLENEKNGGNDDESKSNLRTNDKSKK